jgi:phosphoribosylformylglycinamidine (FGAM) synthase PurS component
VKSLADRLLADPVTQTAVVSRRTVARLANGRRAEIWFKKGVADPVADTVRLAAADLGVKGLDGVRSGRVFDFHGPVTARSGSTLL